MLRESDATLSSLQIDAHVHVSTGAVGIVLLSMPVAPRNTVYSVHTERPVHTRTVAVAPALRYSLPLLCNFSATRFGSWFGSSIFFMELPKIFLCKFSGNPRG